MSTETIPTRSAGQTITEEWPNLFKRVIITDFLPRDASGVVVSLAGSLGSATYKWLRAHIKVGGWSCGDVKQHLSFNNTILVDQGWFPLNGQILNQTNYDTYHGAGSWAAYIGTSPLNGKYMPLMTNRYPAGTLVTGQDGSIAFTVVGNPSSQINIAHVHAHAHTHTMAHTHTHPHTHTLDTGGTVVDGGAGTVSRTTGQPSAANTDAASVSTTSAASVTNTDSSLSSTQNIRPESIEFEFYVRVI